MQAYCQFTCWVHRKLSLSTRRVVPAYVAKAIHDKFSNTEGTYKGYESAL